MAKMGAEVGIQTDPISDELLSSWESLLKWSENTSVARQLQEEMVQLKVVLNRFGTKSHLLDSKTAIEVASRNFQEEKVKLNSHRSTMLKLNSSVHSWVTRQENELKRIQKQLANGNCDIVSGSVKIVSDGGLVGSEEDLSVAKMMGKLETVIPKNTNIEIEVLAETSEKSAQVQHHYDTEMHTLLKDNVSDLYNSWDEADSRINNELEVLQMALQTWTQLEIGLCEFTETLGKDKFTLEELRDVLEMGDVRLPDEFVIDVRQASKLLSIETAGIQHKLQTSADGGVLLHPSSAILYNLKSSSNGSLSDSGISDGGCGSDGGLSERERRLGGLRRLAKQLESSLAPGSAALKSIYQRMEAAELELKSLQQTCRDLLVRTTSPVSHTNGKETPEETDGNVGSSESDHKNSPIKGKSKKSPQSKRKNKKRSSQEVNPNHLAKSVGRQQQKVVQSADSEESADKDETDINAILFKNFQSEGLYVMDDGEVLLVKDDGGGDEFDSDNGLGKDDIDGDEKKKKGWAWRVAKIAIPLQFALVSLFCVACLFEPQCCDVINNFSMSFTPQLRYIRGPPPV